MKVSLEFINIANHSLEKPKGYCERFGDIYVSLWSGWELVVIDTREEYGYSIRVERYIAKPTPSMIRKVKKRLW